MTQHVREVVQGVSFQKEGEDIKANRKLSPFEALYRKGNFEQHQFDAGMWAFTLLKLGERSPKSCLDMFEIHARISPDGKTDFELDCLKRKGSTILTLAGLKPDHNKAFNKIVVQEQTLTKTCKQWFGYNDSNRRDEIKGYLCEALDELASVYGFAPREDNIRTGTY